MVAYEGNKPYIFISYAHKDAEPVMAIIAYLQEQGFRVWYDQGIEAGSDWTDDIADHIRGSACMIAMISQNYKNSENCIDEIVYAQTHNVRILPVYLEDVKLNSGMEMKLGRHQAILRKNYASQEAFLQAFLTASMLQPCTDRKMAVQANKKANSKSLDPALWKKVGIGAAIAVVLLILILLLSSLGSRDDTGSGNETGMGGSNTGTTSSTDGILEEKPADPLLQAYGGPYSTGITDGEAMVQLLTCDEEGNLTGYFEFMASGTYGKYYLTGKVLSREEEKTELTLEAGDWIEQPDAFATLDTMEVTISNDYQRFQCDAYGIDWTIHAIRTMEDLKKLENADGFFTLANDIDMAQEQWTPISNFSGVLYGGGHSIQNLQITASQSNVGFFTALSARVWDLKFENASVTVTGKVENVGILCGTLNQADIRNITVSGTVSAPDAKHVGGIAGLIQAEGNYTLRELTGQAHVTGNSHVGGIAGNFCDSKLGTVKISGLSNSGTILAADNYAGGILGYMQVYDDNWTSELYLEDLHNTGNVTGKYYVGGILGYGESDFDGSVLKNCSNQSEITAEAVAGAIAGKLFYIAIDSCTNEGSAVTASGHMVEDSQKCAYLGGMVGHGFLANNCTNQVELQYTGQGSYVGGILGYAAAEGTKSCTELSNQKNISGAACVGGIFGGYVHSRNMETTLSAFENTGHITGSGDYVGGIIGYLYCHQDIWGNQISASDFSNTGDVTGKKFVGGIFGSGQSDGKGSVLSNCTNQSAVTGEAAVGTIAGRLLEIGIDGCSNEGSTLSADGYMIEDGKKYAYVGGLVGYGGAASNSTNSVTVNYTGQGGCVGGIVGCSFSRNANTYTELVNLADVTGASYVGGIFGDVQNYNYGTITMTCFQNSGTVTASGNYVGGILGNLLAQYGFSDSTVSILDFENTGDVTGVSYVGGLLGCAETNSAASTMADSVNSGKVTGTSEQGELAGSLKNLEII